MNTFLYIIHKLTQQRRAGSLFIRIFFLAFLLVQHGESKAQCTAEIGNYSPLIGCEILTVQFHDSTSGPELSRTWDFGDGSATSSSSGPLHNFSAGFLGDTSYVITLSTVCISGPASTAYDTVKVYKKPKVNFASNKFTLCALTDSACFTNLSTSGPGYTYLWNFGDFTTSSAYQPCHIYSTGGVYPVQLTVTNSHGCANSVTYSSYITVIPAPTLDFNLSSFLGCSPMGVSFSNITDTVATSFTSWQWNFGDGSPVINAFNPPSHTFLLPGTYFITMSATNSLGCSNSTTKAIVVRTTPTSTFTAISPVCAGSNSLLTYTGNAGAGALYAWNFAGGVASPGSGAGPHNVSWNSAGTMNVQLTVTDSGCTSSFSLPVTVNPLPVVTLNVFPNDTICQGQTVTFTASPSTLVNYQFYVNSVMVQDSSSSSFTSSSLSDGDSIYVTGSNAFNCASLGSNAVVMKVNPLPSVSLSSSGLSACAGDSLVFTASPSGYDSYSFFQGFLVLQNSASSVYSTTGWVNGNSIYVTATENGCTGPPSNILTPLVTQPLPTPQVNCGTSTDSTIQFTWLPVSGASGYLVSVNGGPYVSPSSGVLGTTQFVGGLTTGMSATIQVIALGPAPCGNSDTSAVHTCFAMNCTGISFSINPYQTICNGDAVTLDLSGFSIASPFASWNGGASTPYSDFTFTPLSDVTIPVVVSNPAQPGCPSASNYFVITVNPLPAVGITVSPAADSICQGTPVTFTASPAGYTDYSFYNGATLMQSSNNPNFTVPDVAGNYYISVQSTYLGCQYSTPALPLTILPAPLVALTSAPGGGTVCYGDTVLFTAFPPGYTTYSFYNGSTLLQSSASNVMSYGGMFVGSGNNISVIAVNSDGCNSTSSNVINFTITPPPSISLACSDLDLQICEGDPVTFTASPSGMLLYEFFNGTTLLQSSASPSFVTSSLLAGNTITVVGTNATGCKTMMSNAFSLMVKPRPVAYISASDTTLCAGTVATLTANQSPVVAGTTYIWSTGATSLTTTVVPPVNTSYVLYSSLNGCQGIPDTLTVLVDNAPLPVTTASGSTTLCIGDSAMLSGSGGFTMIWTPSSGLNDPTIPDPKAAPTVSTTYTLTTSNLYCTSSASVTVNVDLCLSDITGPIPTGITPNGDGTNDFFVIPDVGYFKKNSLTIYNRWGSVIFKAAPYANDWNGRSLNGQDLPDAIYYYVLDLGNDTDPHAGYVVIQR
ncbi:MAG: PKD domain-containing protein [Bacteroidia bacterium]